MKKYQIVCWLSLIMVIGFVVSGCGGAVEEPPTPAPTPTPSGDAAHGETLFNQTCLSCHGPGGVGIEGLGKDMTTSTFISRKSDDQMVTFIKTGRPTSDPLNTTGIDMPPKGGNPALTDAELLDIVAYIRSIQK